MNQQNYKSADRYYDDSFTPTPYAPPPKTNSKSIVSLVLGILSITLPYIGFLIGIAAIIFASISFKEIRMRMEQGKGLAVAGLVCGIVGTALYAIVILLVLFFAVFISYSTY
ncbi:DUF4190 domain-containing protein [Paenibacillus silvae]|uniref:DUF4190 domain-containing protein n=1 Tax=Paenibacillus silvae TaxID=1325358 RepID=A0A2W6QDM1_9BACL|nr:DUF4190 domain-containing protein [Paenibacillus silvae]PZT55333.1 hypothetical protein DN757_12630 [Paenibacillus silvae]